MEAALLAKLEKIAAAGIQILPTQSISGHLVFERDGFVALVEHREQALGRIGAAGLAAGLHVAPLVWRSERPFFVAKNFEQPATDEQVAAIRRFQEDLEQALR